jgi:hypothetical protein
MIKLYFLTVFSLVLCINSLQAQEEHHPKTENSLKRHKLGLFTGNTLIHGVHNTHTGKEQYVLAPTFGLDYEYWFSHKWAIGTYNEVAFLNIEVEQDHEVFVKRETGMLFSGVVVYEAFPRFSIFAGTGVEVDPSHTLWIRYLGLEYAFIRSDNWEVSFAAGYVNKDLYDAFTFGFVIGRRFGNAIPSHHRNKKTH